MRSEGGGSKNHKENEWSVDLLPLPPAAPHDLGGAKAFELIVLGAQNAGGMPRGNRRRNVRKNKNTTFSIIFHGFHDFSSSPRLHQALGAPDTTRFYDLEGAPRHSNRSFSGAYDAGG